MNILITSTDNQKFKPTLDIITSHIKSIGHNPINWDDDIIETKDSAAELLENVHKQADILLAFINEATYGVFIEIGYATAKKMPIIIICTLKDLNELTPDHFSEKYIIYDPIRIDETLLNPLKNLLAVDNVEQFVANSKKNEKLNVFVSYSHADTEFLERLKIHIKPLERSGLIDFWSDTKIKTGTKWKASIETALEKAAVAILLISADFLASDFIVDNELPPLLKKAEEKGLTIIPVILKPCRFAKDKNLSEFQSINPPSLPLSKMTESDREECYVKITDSIDAILNFTK